MKHEIEPIYTGGRVQLTSDGKWMIMTSGAKLHVRCVQSGGSVLALNPPSSTTPNPSNEQTEVEGYWQAFCLHSTSLYTVNLDGLLEMYSLKYNESDITATLCKSWKLNNPKKSPVRFMAHHPSAALLVTAFADGSVSGWDSQKGFCTHNYKTTGSSISSLSFNEFELLVGRESGVLSIYDLLNTASDPRHLSLHVSAVTFAGVVDGSLLTAGRDRVINLTSSSNGKLIKTVPVFESVEDAVLIGKMVCLIGDKGCVSIWDSEKGKCITTSHLLSSTESHLLRQCFILPGGAAIMVISDELQFIRLSSDKLTEESRMMGHFGEVTDFAMLPDGKLAVSSNGPEIALFPEYAQSMHCSFLRGHTQAVISLAVCEDVLVSGSRDHSMRIWYAGKSICCEGHTDSVSSVAICKTSPSTFVVASASGDLTVKLWHFDAVSGSCQAVWTVKAHEKEINALCFSPCTKMLISASQDKSVRIWSVTEGKLMHTLNGHKRGVWSVACVKGQEALLATGSADRTIKLWRLCEDFSCVKTFEGHANSVLRIGFMNSATQLVSAGSDGLIKIWDIRRSECLITLDDHVDRIWALNVIEDGAMLVTGDASAHIKFWQDVSSQERAQELQRNDEILLKEQELQILLLRKEFPKAVLLALSLEQPFRLYGLFQDLLRERSTEDALEVVTGLLEQLPGLEEHFKLLTYLREWNISYRRSFASQILLAGILRNPRFSELLKEKPEVKDVLQGILPYTGKHYERTDELMIESQIVDFALLHMQ